MNDWAESALFPHTILLNSIENIILNVHPVLCIIIIIILFFNKHFGHVHAELKQSDNGRV